MPLSPSSIPPGPWSIPPTWAATPVISPGLLRVDTAGNAYVTGETSSSNFPRRESLPEYPQGAINAFVTKLNAAGNRPRPTPLTWVELRRDYGFGIAVDSVTTAYVAGFTTSTNFPTRNPFQATPALTSTGAAFVTKLLWSDITAVISLLLWTP